MARLIDADRLIENINEIYKGYMTDECGCVPYDFERIVDEQPTAYDIDKVVEELKEWSVNATILELHNNELGEYEEECKRDVICTLNAIDIVKGGGKNDN